jgi:8-oxo-dGTP pyrophosphatase MutT (NUDIX family)
MASWKRTQSSKVGDYGVFEVHRHAVSKDGLPLGRDIHTLETVDWCNVVPVTREGNVVLIELHRFGVERQSIEIPGGLIDEGEEPIVAARRELEEETGYRCDDIVPLGVVNANPALQRTRLHMFLAKGCHRASEQALEELEDCRPFEVSREQLVAMVKRGEIGHALVLTALYAWELHER